jgi:integrating conjugative element protein (TIGR03746 family)
MSRVRNEVAQLTSHINTLRIALAGVFLLALVMGAGWWHSPRDLTVHVPPDLRSGSTRKWWDVPPESVYSFTFYVWQQIQRWPTDGDVDYPRNLKALSAYLTPGCANFLQQDFVTRQRAGELRKRVRGVYEIPGRGYTDTSVARVRQVSQNNWTVTLDLVADEYLAAERVKRAFARYPFKVERSDIDPQRNPFGLVIDCYESLPQRIDAPGSADDTDSSSGDSAS